MALIDGLVGGLRLDGNSQDVVGLGYASTEINTLYSAPYGKLGQGVRLRSGGTESRLVSSISPAALGNGWPFSISFWLRMWGGTTDRGFWEWGTPGTDYAGWGMSSSWNGSFNIQNGIANVLYMAPGYLTATWRHFVLTADVSRNLKMYSNGVLSSTGVTPGYVNQAGNLQLGRSHYVATSPDADMDEVYLWSRDLSLAEVGELYNGGDGLEYPWVSARPLWLSTVLSRRSH